MINKIKKGSKIGVIAPAFQPDKEKLDKGLAYLLDSGYKVVRGKSLDAIYGYLAGNDLLRVDDLHTMFSDPEVDAIICARGGWGCLRILDQLDYDLIRKNPKILVGYSDITTLHLAIWKKSGLPGISGPMTAIEMGTGIEPFTEKHFWDQVYNTGQYYEFTWEPDSTETWQTGEADGILLGGCLAMVAHQLGTDYSPDYKDSILLLEDVGEEPYRIDRYLAQLRQAGIFDQINGLILGNFLDCENQNPDRPSFTVKEVLQEYCQDLKYPVIYDFPYGHGMIKISVPIGMHTQINTNLLSIKFANPFAR
jgi:muramoyltetrapeptide carboxypeptidase